MTSWVVDSVLLVVVFFAKRCILDAVLGNCLQDKTLTTRFGWWFAGDMFIMRFLFAP